MAKVTEQLTKSSVEIVHAVPGRIRLRVPQLSEDMELAQQLERLALTTPGITSIRINRAAESVIITYRADISTNTKIRSRLESLIHSAGVSQSVTQPAQSSARGSSGSRAALRSEINSELRTGCFEQARVALPEGKDQSLRQELQQPRLVKDLEQQLAEARQQLTTQAEQYKSLQQKYQQQSRLVEELQQQLAKLQQLEQTKDDQPQSLENQAQLQRLAKIGEWQLNKWRRRLYF